MCSKSYYESTKRKDAGRCIAMERQRIEPGGICRKNELNLQTFRYWISKLRKDEDDAPAFIALDGFAPTQISLNYPNGVELILPAQTSVSVLKGLIHFDNRCSR